MVRDYFWAGQVPPPLLPPRVNDVRVVVTLAAEESVVLFIEVVRSVIGVMGGASAEGRTMPVNAWNMSAIGGVSSAQGTVKSGLSQRLWVVGSS